MSLKQRVVALGPQISTVHWPTCPEEMLNKDRDEKWIELLKLIDGAFNSFLFIYGYSYLFSAIL
jgi:hypothetical protein